MVRAKKAAKSKSVTEVEKNSQSTDETSALEDTKILD
jgi:hypothetical protein